MFYPIAQIMRILLFTFLMALGTFIQAADANAFQTGVTAFNNGEIEAAIAAWESVPGESVALHYNLGNAWFRNGNAGRAVLHYERALKLDHRDEDVLNNLAVVQESLIDKFELLPQPVYKTVALGFLKMAPLSFWTIGALVLLMLSAGLFAGFIFLNQHRKALLVAFLSTLLAGFIFWGLAELRYQQVDAIKDVVVLSPNVYVKTAPAETGSDSFILHEGTKARLLETHEQWMKIRLPDGKIGWAPKSALEII
jgi:tetratricopeptide (TPR) repeat protein